MILNRLLVVNYVGCRLIRTDWVVILELTLVGHLVIETLGRNGTQCLLVKGPLLGGLDQGVLVRVVMT